MTIEQIAISKRCSQKLQLPEKGSTSHRMALSERESSSKSNQNQ